MIDRVIPCSPEVYQATLAFYYQETSPAHLLAMGLGFMIVVLLSRPSLRGPLTVQLALAGFWVWTGLVFHGRYFGELNWAGTYFGYVFVAQGLLIAVHGFLMRRTHPQPESVTRVTGCSLVVLAMALSPTISSILETPLSHAHLFGMTPLPLVIATTGIYIVVTARTPIWLVGIPVVWTLWNGLTAQALGLWHDLALAIMALLSIVGMLIYQRRSHTN